MTVANTTGITHCCEAIRREFTEQPGLRLTHQQAMRLSDADAEHCHSALELLVDEGFLIVVSDGHYGRPGLGVDEGA
jgi:hypothetical protein